jgi:hypothetical protein
MSTPFFDLSGAFYAQKNHLIDLQNRDVTDRNLTTKLNSISNNLDNLYNNFKNASGTTSSILTNQTDVQEIVNTELNRLNQKKSNVDTALEGQKRMVQLNDSYRQKYLYFTRVLVIVVVFLILYIIINISSNYLTTIPETLFDVIYFILGVLFLFIIIFFYLDYLNRDKMDFNKLNYGPPNIPPSAKQIEEQQKNALRTGDLLGSINVRGCIGDKCCSVGTKYDSGNSVCIKDGFTTIINSDKKGTPSNYASEITEYSFINEL